MKTKFEPRIWNTLLLVLMIYGCGVTSPAVSFYKLSSMYGGNLPPAPDVNAREPAIGIESVILSDYLERPQLTTRSGPNQVRIDEFHRWAGPLARDIQRVLAENLMAITGSHRIAQVPWANGFDPDIIVSMQVYAFEGFYDGAVRLLASVTITDRRSDSASTSWTVDLQEPAAGRDYADMVAAQSRLMAALSRQIAEAIAQLPSPLRK